jgi:hypothetical protein
MRSRDIFIVKLIGWLIASLGGALLLLVLLNVRTREAGGHDVSDLVWPAVCLLVCGVGVIFRRRLAAVISSVLLVVAAGSLAVASILKLPDLWPLANIATSIIIATPALLLFRYRGSLR